MENNLLAAAGQACSVAAGTPWFWVVVAFCALILGAVLGHARRNK